LFFDEKNSQVHKRILKTVDMISRESVYIRRDMMNSHA